VDGVGPADALEQRLSAETLVGSGAVRWDAAFVSPVDVDLPPVDLVGGSVGETLIAEAGRLATGEGDREVGPGTVLVGVDDAIGEGIRYVIDDHEVPEHGGEA
jgi:hypothetical protein